MKSRLLAVFLVYFAGNLLSIEQVTTEGNDVLSPSSKIVQADVGAPSGAIGGERGGPVPAATASEEFREWSTAVSASKQCLIESITTLKERSEEQFGLVNRLPQLVANCSCSINQALQSKTLSNRDENKGFIDFVDESYTGSCFALTLGIGGDILAEEKLKSYRSNCSFVGADPIPGSGKIFESLGVYVPFAISNMSGKTVASVLKGGVYSPATVDTVEFVEFLKKFANVSKIIDFLFLDAEGAEYPLMPYFHRPGALERAGITVCQLNVEWHRPLEYYGISSEEHWQKLMTDFLSESDLLPLWIYQGVHTRGYLVNVQSEQCFERFFKGHCFDSCNA